jgi:hypothetical protein
LESSFETIQTFAETTGDVIGEALGILAQDDLDFFAEKKIEAQLEEENRIRREQLALQRLQVEAEVALAEARRQRLNQEKPIELSVRAEGLEPQLEQIWFQVIERLQVLVSEQLTESLLGLIESGAT